jgi:hypothetical protein
MAKKNTTSRKSKSKHAKVFSSGSIPTTLAVRTIIGETGLDMNCWKSEKALLLLVKIMSG